MDLTLPNNETAERNLIGLALLDGRIPTGAKDVSTTDFHNRHYRAAWSAFLELDGDGREIETFAAYEILTRNSPNAAPSFAVSDLANTTVGMVSCNESPIVEKIQNAAKSRYLMRQLYASIESLSKGGDADSFADLKTKLEDLEIKTTGRGTFKPLSEILTADVAPALVNLRHGITNRISTGFARIDEIIGGGLSQSDIVVVAALPGAGKSSFVLQLATNIAKQGVPVAFVSGEMSDTENGLRVVSQSARFVNLNSVTHISENQHDYLNKWSDALKMLPLYFDSKTSDLQSLERSLRVLVQETQVKVLIIDYIQLFKLNRYDRQSRTERIAECSQEVKRIAMQYGLAVVEVAQFNREGAKSLKSSMHDLEGSGQLEKDASLVFIIDRDEESSEVNLRIVKGRNTGKCAVRGIYEGATLTFEF